MRFYELTTPTNIIPEPKECIFTSHKTHRIKKIKKGDWIDLIAPCNLKIQAPVNCDNVVSFHTPKMPLGIAMELPKGYEAIVLPRSSTFKKFGVVLSNSAGVIDNSYCGNKDEWQAPFIGFRNSAINKGERILQFRIQLSQFATPWQKIKWLFVRKIKFVVVDILNNKERGGFGSTGYN